MPSPRRFTRAELTSTITTGNYNAMSPADKLAFDTALTALWVDDARWADTLHLSGDYDLVGSNRRFELGE